MASQAPANAAAASSQIKVSQKDLDGLNLLRQEQRQLGGKLAEVESDVKEHQLVIEALKGTPSDRRCFRSVGGVLIEQKVAEVIVDLEKSYELLKKTTEIYNKNIEKKAQEMTDYVKEHNLTSLLRNVDGGDEGTKKGDSSSKPSGTSVLV